MAHGRVFEKTTKSDRVRVLSIGGATVAVIEAHRARAEHLAQRLGGDLQTSAFVFASSRPGSTEAYRPDTITENFERLRSRVGLERVSFHSLRHFHATQLIAGGIDVRTVAGRLGHASPAVTLGVYSAFLPARDQTPRTPLIESSTGDGTRILEELCDGPAADEDAPTLPERLHCLEPSSGDEAADRVGTAPEQLGRLPDRESDRGQVICFCEHGNSSGWWFEPLECVPGRSQLTYQAARHVVRELLPTLPIEGFHLPGTSHLGQLTPGRA
jgi:hypothetical protein